jgi:serine protease Do
LIVVNTGFRWVLILLLIGLVDAQTTAASNFTELVQNHRAAVVNIGAVRKLTVTQELTPLNPEKDQKNWLEDLLSYFFEEDQEKSEQALNVESSGSGLIISVDGYILTNYHVVEDAWKIRVRLYDRRELPARLVGSDILSDVALLKISAVDLPVAPIGRSSDLQVGEWVLAIGSPFGFEQSVAAGIISAKGRSLPRESYVPFIQTDVAINPGNSGGPLFNMKGEVVGVNSQIYSRTGGYMGLSFAIPIEIAMHVAEQLKNSGKVARGWLGVMVREVTAELANAYGMRRPQGALIARVLPNGPAATAGLRSGDVVLEFADQPIEISSALPPLVGLSAVGETVEIKLLRAGKPLLVQVTIGELPED